MKKTTSLLLAALVSVSVFTTAATADASKGQRIYLKKLKGACKKDGLKSGAVFAIKHDRHGWEAIQKAGKLKAEWVKICPHAAKKVKKLRKKDVKNLYDFVWKYASDGATPSCG
ncbi:MAG: cytochrome C [Epsilonproteobacteria bacterium]|nr:cytochrome C [Campylobacterota bacterium]